MKTKASYDVPAVRKLIPLIELLCESSKPLSLTEICKSIEATNNMVFRLLHTLKEEGWVVESESNKYEISLIPYHHFSKPVARMSLTRAAQNPLRELWEQTGESCYLGVIDGMRTQFIEHLDATGDVRIAAVPGGRFPMHCAAPGKVLLAYSDDEFVDAVISEEGLAAQTENTITESKKLKAELAGIRKCGFGTDLEEFGDGIICFAAPIFDFSGALVGTIGLSVLTLYYTPDELNEQLGAKVCAAARAISANLGFKESSNNEI